MFEPHCEAHEIKNLKFPIDKQNNLWYNKATKRKEDKDIMDFEKKRNQLKDTAFKLVYKHPYSVVRNRLDKIGRQIREIDEKVKPGKGKEKAEQGNIGLGCYYGHNSIGGRGYGQY